MMAESITTDAEVELARDFDEDPDSNFLHVEKGQDSEAKYRPYLGLMPPELQEGNVDIAIMHSDEDSDEAEIFKNELMKIEYKYNGNMHHPKVKLIEEMGIGHDGKKLTGLIMKKASIIFLFITRSFLDDPVIYNSGHSAMLEAIQNFGSVTVMLVLTEKELRKALVPDLKFFRHINYWQGFDKCRKHICGLLELNACKLNERDEDLESRRSEHFKTNIENCTGTSSARLSQLPQISSKSSPTIASPTSGDASSNRDNQKLPGLSAQMNSLPNERETIQHVQSDPGPINNGATANVSLPTKGDTQQSTENSKVTCDFGTQQVVHHHYHTTHYTVHKAKNVALGKNSSISFNTGGSKHHNLSSSSESSESDSEIENSAEETSSPSTRDINSTSPKQAAQSSTSREKQDTAKYVGIFWDIENCSIPKGKCPREFVRRVKDKYCKGFTLWTFYVPCNTKEVLSENIQKALEKVVTLDNRIGDKKNVCDVSLVSKMNKFARECPKGSRLVLITCDGDFTEVISDLQLDTKELEFVLVHRERVEESLLKLGVKTDSFETLIKDLPPFEKPPKYTLRITGYLRSIDLDTLKQTVKIWAAEFGGEAGRCKQKASIMQFDSIEKAREAKTKLEERGVYLSGKKITFTLMGSQDQAKQHTEDGTSAPSQGYTDLPQPGAEI